MPPIKPTKSGAKKAPARGDKSPSAVAARSASAKKAWLKRERAKPKDAAAGRVSKVIDDPQDPGKMIEVVDPVASRRRSKAVAGIRAARKQREDEAARKEAEAKKEKKEKVAAAKATKGKVGKPEHVFAEKVEIQLARDLKGDQLSDSEALDVRVKGKGGREHAIEVKCRMKGKKKTLSVHDDALYRKVEYVRDNPKAAFHTVMIDHRDNYADGVHSANYSGHRLYYKRGCASYSVSMMYKVKDEAELRKLLEMKEHELPELARGTFPTTPDEIETARVKGEIAHQKRLDKDRRRREKNKAEGVMAPDYSDYEDD